MENRLMIGGFGGQGGMLMGQLLGLAACEAGKESTYLPVYGPEQRGGTANCTVIISDEEVGSPVAPELDVLIALNEPSLVKFQNSVRPGGTIVVNSSMVTKPVQREDVRAYYIPADDIADQLGSKKVANVVMLGAYINVSKALTAEEIMAAIKVKLAKKANMLAMNEAALQKGIEATN